MNAKACYALMPLLMAPLVAAPQTTSAQAQPPAMALAHRAAVAAMEACKGTPVAVAMIDSAGLPRLVLAGDGARSMFAGFALRKAQTALRYGKPSAAVRDAAKSDPALAETLKTDPALIGFGGGWPFAGGAFAVAGAPSQDTDDRCAQAALAILNQAQP